MLDVCIYIVPFIDNSIHMASKREMDRCDYYVENICYSSGSFCIFVVDILNNWRFLKHIWGYLLDS